jgi:hypothetical protein
MALLAAEEARLIIKVFFLFSTIIYSIQDYIYVCIVVGGVPPRAIIQLGMSSFDGGGGGSIDM